MRCFVVCLLALASVVAQKGNCTFYTNKTTHCADGCGDCFNPGGRKGVMCPGATGQVGYYCSPDGPPVAFACMDWTFGSKAMMAAESTFNKRSGGDPVYFGVGTFGTSTDAQRGLGACYKLTVATVDRPLLVQSVNTGSDVDGNQFDLQIGAGGAGAYNTCAGAPSAMYPGSTAPWGHQYGGPDNRKDCAALPPYPQIPGPMKAAGDNLVELCEYGFDKQVRGEGGSNPTIETIERVACPAELVHFTQIQRSDDPAEEETIALPSSGGAHKCDPASSLAWCLTRMMDCRKPSGGFKDNIQPNLVKDGMRVVQPCTSDGYTRIDVQCGCLDCYC